MAALNHPPLTIKIMRAGFVESSHAVHAVVMQGGEPAAIYGDAARMTFPRSSIKLLQALPLIESGAADAFGLTDEEIALSCASHGGEDAHTRKVGAWLNRIHLDESDLECGPQAPGTNPCQPATQLCNNCSGKHVGMLTLSLFLKARVLGYTDVDHPVQQKILARISSLCGENLTASACGVDGCAAPAPIMRLESLARAFANFIAEKSPAPARILRAMAAYPHLVAGRGMLDTALISATNGKVICKTGAEGVYIALAPVKETVIALKAEDGATRASVAALHLLLQKYNLADPTALGEIREISLPSLKNRNGVKVGHIE